MKGFAMKTLILATALVLSTACTTLSTPSTDSKPAEKERTMNEEHQAAVLEAISNIKK